MSTREPWHLSSDQLAGYLAGTASRALVASVEAHLLACERCRSALAETSGPAPREEAWARLADEIDRPSPGTLPRLARGDRILRASIATPTMVAAALAAVVMVGAVPLLTALAAPQAGLVTLLVVAPLAPSIAVALAYREWCDPAGELAAATPMAGLRLVALRALAVSLVALPSSIAVLLAVDAWLSPVPIRFGLAWCLPGLALAALVLLAGTTRLDPWLASAVLGVGWSAAVAATVTVRRTLRPEQFLDGLATPEVQALALAVATGALLLTAARRHTVDTWGNA